VDGNMVFAAGVTAGIDGVLRLVAELRGDDVAQTIQLHIAYAPEAPFNSGTPATARRVAERLGIAYDTSTHSPRAFLMIRVYA